MNTIQYGDYNQYLIEEARDIYYKNDLRYSNIKRNLLPCYTLNFTFDSYRRNANLIDSTGYIYIDIDDSTNIDFNNPLIYATWLSLSGYGRGALVKVDNLNKYNYKTNYNLISNELGIKPDNGARKLSQLNVLSYDPDIYINSNSEVWVAKDLTSTEKKKAHYSENNNNNSTIPNVMCFFDNEIRYDNLKELIENVEFNGDVIYDFRTKVYYSKTHIPFRSIKNGYRNNTLTGIAYQHRALNPFIERERLFRFVNRINQTMCFEPLPVKDIDTIIESVMSVEDIQPLENASRRFVFNSDYDITIREKRQEIMKVLNSDRVAKSKMKIENAIKDWDFECDGKITIKSLSIVTGMHRNTILKYYPLYKSEIHMLNKKYYKKK
ncbi:primase C-terminal domain-containing protein [Aestuariivivens sediminicola]|uniref:primase C-terminal domain-containing protein n=1 Tax=Aestuariivivens sediminicola TaxID=2913560 RepID=UPI001F56E0CB|nr:BT4734/BF3469 family protein [Aestuariivivens sediminicola]